MKKTDANDIARELGEDELRKRSGDAWQRGIIQHAAPNGHASQEQGLSISVADFLAVSIPPRKLLLAPWLKQADAAMIHSWRGIGKTHVGVGVAAAIASGGQFLRWTAPQPARVLYVDGEMPQDQMQERFRAAIASCPGLPSGQYLRLITPDRLPDNTIVPNLLTPEGQAAIEPDLEGVELVLFDNVATLFRNGEDQNQAGSWLGAQDYILRLRRRHIASILIDHDNKTGGNRGTSAKHDVLDVVIHLTRPADYLQPQGARFNVGFTKSRGFWGRDAEPFEARLIETINGPAWTVTDAADVMLERVAEMLRDGISERDIRAELQIGGSKLSRFKKKIADRAANDYENPRKPSRPAPRI